MVYRKSSPIFLSFLIISSVALFIGCGGGGGSSENDLKSTESVRVSGYALDKNGNPVSGAEVTISSEPVTVTTDSEGYFSADVVVGQHEIRIKKDTITIYSKSFNCQENEPFDFGNISTTYDPDDIEDNDSDGYASDDCDDADPSVNPGATEICDDVKDNDCDGDIDGADSDCRNVNPMLDGTVLYFESNRMLLTTELNGTVFEGGFSFSGWFYFIELPAENGDIIIGNEFGITYQGENSVQLQLKSTNANITGLSMQTWNNFAVTYDLSTVNYYVNGRLVKTAQTSGPFVFNNDEGALFSVGGFNIQSFYGYASQIKIWNRGLSNEELILEIDREDSSDSLGIKHQWLFNEGRGNKAIDSVGGVDFQFGQHTPTYWIDLDGPYEIDHDSILRVSDENKILPIFASSFGSADLNQDGFQDLFYHGPWLYLPPTKTPLLALQNDGTGYFSDASDSLIDGGLYFKLNPSGRETIIADLNNDGFEDIFIRQFPFMGDNGVVLGIETNSLLLSNGNSGKLYPSESTIMSPPCTLEQPEFSGQKPCSSDTVGNIYYPDNTAPLVPIDIRSYHYGSTSGDIDNDGDIDIFVSTANGEEYIVLPYFLINGGNGNFTANWQMVPNKAFRTESHHPSLETEYEIVKLEDIDRDGFLDLVMLGGGLPGLAEHIPSDPFDVEQDYWDASAYDLIAWGSEGGFSESYTILLHKVSLFTNLLRTILTIDIDMDGDLDIIATKQTADSEDGNAEAGYFLQVFSNNGDRTFTDVTQQSIPQDPDIVANLQLLWNGEMRQIDFNGDQCPDFFQQSIWLDYHITDQPYAMWLNNCKGYFTPIERRFIGKMGLLIPLDADGDGDLDFVSQTTGGDLSGNEILEYTLLRRTRNINIEKYIDTDRDGIRDIDDNDDDGDGVIDSEDAFPKDKYDS